MATWKRIDKSDGSEEPVDEARVLRVVAHDYVEATDIVLQTAVGNQINTTFSVFEKVGE